MDRYIQADDLFHWDKHKLSDAIKYGNEDAAQQNFSYSTLMMYEIADEIGDAPGFETDIPLNRLRELARAEKDGRLVVLPCRVGDVLWTYCTWPENYIYSAEVVAVEVSDGAVSIKADRISNVMPAGDIGKTVFLTRAEAEAALEKKERGNATKVVALAASSTNWTARATASTTR